MDGPENMGEAAAEDEEEWENVAQPPSQRAEQQNTAFPPGAHERCLRPHSRYRHLGVEEEEQEERGWMQRMYSGFDMVYSRIISATLRSKRPEGGGGGCLLPLSLGAAVVLMGFLMHQRRRQRREKELLDKRIKQLLEQITLLNEVIAAPAPSRVPILKRF